MSEYFFAADHKRLELVVGVNPVSLKWRWRLFGDGLVVVCSGEADSETDAEMLGRAALAAQSRVLASQWSRFGDLAGAAS